MVRVGRALVAVDLGAQSCRVSLLRSANGRPEIRVVYRFRNAPVASGTGLHWDMGGILAGVLSGLRRCAELAPEGIASLGVDGWAVDYVRLAADGTRLGDPFCYRDERAGRAMRDVLALITPERLYALTGIQIISLNTLFQLYADRAAGLSGASGWLNLPEYVTYRLGGRPVAEFTNATHTQLVALGQAKWCAEIFSAAGLELSSAPEIVATGTLAGTLGGELRRLAAFSDTRLVVPACHDTASAIAAIPAVGDDWAFISSGTWSLVGTVLARPCVSDQARKMNFTNLGGVGGSICFLKNVNGMWLLRQCLDAWAGAGQAWTAEELVRECPKLPPPDVLIDVDDPALAAPGDLPAKINAQLDQAGHAPLPPDRTGIPQMANLIFHSLARRYAEVVDGLRETTGKRLKRLFIVGGGARNEFLNRLTAERTGVELHCGPAEASTIGNFAVQLAALAAGGYDRGGVPAAEAAAQAEGLASVPFADFME